MEEASGDAASPNFVESVEQLEVGPRVLRQIAKAHCAKFVRGLNH